MFFFAQKIVKNINLFFVRKSILKGTEFLLQTQTF